MKQDFRVDSFGNIIFEKNSKKENKSKNHPKKYQEAIERAWSMFKEHSVGTATMAQYDEAIKKELLEGIVFVAPFMDNNQRGLVTFEVDQYDLRENNKLLIHVSYYYAGSFTYVGHSDFPAHSLSDVDRDCDPYFEMNVDEDETLREIIEQDNDQTAYAIASTSTEGVYVSKHDFEVIRKQCFRI